MSGILKSVCIKSKQDNLMHNIGQADLIKTGIHIKEETTTEEEEPTSVEEESTMDSVDETNKEMNKGE